MNQERSPTLPARLVFILFFLSGAVAWVIANRLTDAPNTAFLDGLQLTAEDQDRLKQTLRAEFRYLFGFQQFLAGMTAQETHQFFDATLAMAPWNDSLRARIYAQYAHIASTRRNPAERMQLQQKAQSLYRDTLTE